MEDPKRTVFIGVRPSVVISRLLAWDVIDAPGYRLTKCTTGVSEFSRGTSKMTPTLSPGDPLVDGGH